MNGHKTIVLSVPTGSYLKASGEFQVIFNLFSASQPVRHLDQSRDIMVPGVAGQCLEGSRAIDGQSVETLLEDGIVDEPQQIADRPRG